MKKEREYLTEPNLVLFVGSDVIGRGENHELGNLLIQRFLHEVAGRKVKPETIIFMNNGVKLVTEDSIALAQIQKLEDQGVTVLACGTCLSRLQLMDKLAAGKVSNMSDITDILLKTERVISL
jgi:selenium metabolism protein YedF